jgi:hypothetical protein
MVAFHAQFDADTNANFEWSKRLPAKAMAWCPARMADAVEDMLSSWRTNNNTTDAECEKVTSAYLPVMLVAMASEYTESPAEAGRSVTDKVPFSFPTDPLNQCFMMSTMQLDLRLQVLTAATEPMTVQSMKAQLTEYSKKVPRMTASYTFAGFTTEWPIQIVQQDRFAAPTPIGEHITAMNLDLTLRATIPRFYGGGTTGDQAFPVVQAITSKHNPLIPVFDAAWIRMMRQSNVESVPGVVLHGIVDDTF